VPTLLFCKVPPQLIHQAKDFCYSQHCHFPHPSPAHWGSAHGGSDSTHDELSAMIGRRFWPGWRRRSHSLPVTGCGFSAVRLPARCHHHHCVPTDFDCVAETCCHCDASSHFDYADGCDCDYDCGDVVYVICCDYDSDYVTCDGDDHAILNVTSTLNVTYTHEVTYIWCCSI